MEKIFTILHEFQGDSPCYEINDYNGEIIKGTIYEKELQQVVKDVFKIEKILKHKEVSNVSSWPNGLVIQIPKQFG